MPRFSFNNETFGSFLMKNLKKRQNNFFLTLFLIQNTIYFDEKKKKNSDTLIEQNHSLIPNIANF